jgi:hypothetical protein
MRGGAVALEPLSRAVLDGVSDGEGAPGRADIGLLTVLLDERPLLGLGGLLDWRTGGRLTALLRASFCTGRLGERVLVPGRLTIPFDRLVLVGLGAASGLDVNAARAVGGQLVDIARDLGAARVLVGLPSVRLDRDLVEALFAALLERLAPDPGGADGAAGPSPGPRWWAVADAPLVPRLRRLLAGPPRPAEPA